MSNGLPRVGSLSRRQKIRAKGQVGETDDSPAGIAVGIAVGAWLFQMQRAAVDPGFVTQFPQRSLLQVSPQTYPWQRTLAK
jgi:hypothetical protein